MTVDDVFKIAGAIIASLGGGAIIVAAFANWLGGIWAKRMLQTERAVHAEKLEELKKELDLLKHKDILRHYDKLAIYKEVVFIIAEMLREMEAVGSGIKTGVDPAVERNFALNRNKLYGFISLVSSQAVMNRYNEMIDFFIPILYEGKHGSWIEMRTKADYLLNEMRKDLGIMDGDVIYKGVR